MHKVKINMSPTLLTKLNILSSNYDIEIGGYLVGKIKDNEIYLKDLLIPEQSISSVHVGISGRAQVELRQRFGDKVKDIIGHWHSHHKLGCFWSGTDKRDMENVMNFKDFFVWIVSSNGEHLIKVSQRRPFRYDFEDCFIVVKSLSIDLMLKRVNNIISKNVNTHNFNTTSIDEEKKEFIEIKEQEEEE